MVFTTRVKYWFLISVMMCAFLPSPAGATDGVDPSNDVTTQLESPAAVNDPVQTVDDSDEASVATEPSVVSKKQLPSLVQKSPKPAIMTTDTSSKQSESNGTETIKMEPKIIPADADVIVSGFEVSKSGRLIALELRNMTNDFVDLSQWAFSAVYPDGDDDDDDALCSYRQTDYLAAKQYFTMTDTDKLIDVDWPKDAKTYDWDMSCNEGAGPLVAIEVTKVTNPKDVIERVDIGAIERTNVSKDLNITTAGVWIRKGLTKTHRTGMFKTDFAKSTNPRLLFYGQLHKVPSSAPLQITEVYVTPPRCAPNDITPLCHRYFKVRNVSQDEIDLSRYRLRAGSPTSRSTTRNTTTLSGKIVSGETVIISQSASGDDIYLGSSDGTVWFEDSYGLRDYKSESSVTPYSSASTVKNTGLSWALDASDDTWRWSLPSPDSANNIIELPQATTSVAKSGGLVPCRSDQYRSVDTNRCRLIASAINSLTPCKTGQYRSPATNRCRSSTLAGSTLKPCRDDQYRSEATNRCRLVLGASTSRKPCTDKQYRSEETNRCRNKVASAVPQAAFAVEPIADSSTAFMGWWLLGGASVVALGYGAWEWRREMLTGIRKLGSIITRQR